MGNGLESNEVDFEVDVGPDQEPMGQLTISVMLVYTWALVKGCIVYLGA